MDVEVSAQIIKETAGQPISIPVAWAVALAVQKATGTMPENVKIAQSHRVRMATDEPLWDVDVTVAEVVATYRLPEAACHWIEARCADPFATPDPISFRLPPPGCTRPREQNGADPKPVDAIVSGTGSANEINFG